jgi:8-oxo-dGTP pyrophosphatase MutT (NUDIX family)
VPHIHELFDFTVEVFVVYQNKVFLRMHDKLGIWLSVGGHIELDEEPNQAALREVKEEVGLDVVLDDSLRPAIPSTEDYYELIPPYFLNIQQNNQTHKHITFVYFARSTTDQIIETIEAEKSPDIKWFTKEELEEDKEIIENIKFYALKALEKLSE